MSRRRTVARWARPAKGLAANLAVFAGTLAFLLLVIEVSLRLSGFSFVLYPEEIEFGKPDPVLLETGFHPDDDLFWVTKGYPEKLGRLRRERPPLVFMGDSCTQLGHYDDAFAAVWSQRQDTSLAYGNVGVAGWSSYQGRRQLERDVVGLAPRVVTIYYGWNDHWIGFGVEDKNVARVREVFASRYSGLRLVQLTMKAVIAMGARETAYPNRVSRDDFRDNLRRMVTVARQHDIRPVLLTAPTAIRAGREPEHLAARHLRNLADIVPLHRSYADAVRRVAAEESAVLCDLEARFSDLPPAELDRSFLGDGIHLTPAGDRRLAELLYACFERRDLIRLLG